MNIKKIFLRVTLLFVLVCAVFYRANAQTPDPGIPGTHTVIKAEYNLGNTAYTFPAAADFPYPSEVTGSVHYPADLTNGPYPVIEILHGRHSTCYDSTTLAVASEGWPCTGVNKSITSYEGYDYLANNMASHGYIVISISANDINANDGGSNQYGLPARGYLMQHHLDLWNTWNTVGGFPGDSLLFVGALNMQNIGTMGHSRGGEGAIFHALLNRRLGSPYGIKAVFTLAPINFYDSVLNGIPLLDVAPYCDGDVNDLEGVHFYDNSRYNDVNDYSPKHEILYMGANHDYFNTVWTPGSPIPGGADDWNYSYSESAAWCGATAAGTGRFDSTTQMAALLPYFAAFYRTYLGHENQFYPILDVDDTIPPSSSTLTSAQVHVSFHPSPVNRLDLNRTDSLNRLTTNTAGGSVSLNNILSSEVCGGGTPEADCSLTTPFEQAKQPHSSGTSLVGLTISPALSATGLQWNASTAWYQNDLPQADENLTNYQDIMFRTSVNYKITAVNTNLNFSVQLIDSAGDISSLPVSNYSNVLFYQPGTQGGDLPKLMFNTVKIPLSDFAGVDLTTVRSVRFQFNESSAGAVFVSDLAFSNPPCSNLSAVFSSAIVPGYAVNYTNNTISGTGDSLIWSWNFGDLASGVLDTSSLQSPSHVYPAAGTYYPCLHVRSYKKNNFICVDSFCQTVIVTPPLGFVKDLNESNITIVPNPANDHIKITGAEVSDVLTLYNPYGQVVFTSTISNPVINLPANLLTGVYYAMITTNSGRVIQKILIER